jgi:hypothetical protein
MCWADVGLVKRNSNNTIVVSIVVVSLHTLSLKLVRNGAPYYEKVLHIVKFWSICARVLTFENFCLSVALCTPCMSMVRWTSSKTSEALCLRSVTHAYTHTHTRAHTHPTHTHTHTHTYTHTHTHKHTYIHTQTTHNTQNTHTHIHTTHTQHPGYSRLHLGSVNSYVCVYVYTYACMCLSIYVYTSIYRIFYLDIEDR